MRTPPAPSIMPQKKNPDVCELIRWQDRPRLRRADDHADRAQGSAAGVQQGYAGGQRRLYSGAIDTVKQCLEVFTPMFSTMMLRRDNMRKAASRGFINATDCADYLTKKGVPFRDAYKTVGRLVQPSASRPMRPLETMTMRDFAAISNKFGDDVYDALDLRTCVAERKGHRRSGSAGGNPPDRQDRQVHRGG